MIDSPTDIAEVTLELLRGKADERAPSGGPPVLWHELTRAEAAEEWPRLYAWVEHLRVRYSNSVRLPDCWWRHNDLIEALQALRDYERGCFAADGPASAGVDWQRAFRDIEARLETWVRRLPCAVAGRAHVSPVVAARLPEEWEDVVRDDLSQRA